jgi:hypothetical protein
MCFALEFNKALMSIAILAASCSQQEFSRSPSPEEQDVPASSSPERQDVPSSPSPEGLDAPASPSERSGTPSASLGHDNPSVSNHSTDALKTGVGTYFDSLGFPYGGCGVPEAQLDSPNYVALNVQDTPGDYTTFYPRPVQVQNKIGAWDNGRNCGRWVRVTIGEFCTSNSNDGHSNKKICGEGEWIRDEYSGATLDMVVADSCQDGNAWCRDDRNHLDLSTSSLEKFKPGLSKKWNNRMVSWRFIESPTYSGDIKIGMRQNAAPYWAAIIITNLRNGIHTVEQYVDGSWRALRTDGDMGQSYALIPTANLKYRIRVYDATDKLLYGGRVYDFGFPQACGSKCTNAYTPVSYTTLPPQ